MMKQKKFLRALLARVKPEVDLKKNGDYWQLRFPDGFEQPIYAEVLGLDRMQALLFDFIVAHKGIDIRNIPFDGLCAAHDRVLAEWKKRGDLIRSCNYADEETRLARKSHGG